MWSVKRFEKDNFQIFEKKNGKHIDTIKAPIYIGDNRYEIKSILSASGGYGLIYNAEDKILNNRKVLIKARRYDKENGLFLIEHDMHRARRIKEIRENTKFEYDALVLFKKGRESRMPNVNDIVEGFCPSIYGPHITNEGKTFYCTDEELAFKEPYIVMQVIEGETLGEYVEKGIPHVMQKRGFKSIVQWERCVLEIAKELTSILQGFHHINNVNGKKLYYIYQDLKPDNIMITSDKVITLLDFGGIKAVVEREDGTSNSNIKNGGPSALGTVGYSAPEIKSDPTSLDRRVDIYTLGATIYHLLTGEKLNEILTEDKPDIPVENLEGKFTPATCELVRKCVEVDKDKRYKDLEEVRTQILHHCFPNLKNVNN